LCFTVKNEPDFEMCFNVTVTQPEDLSVFSKVNKNKVSLNMYGSSSYQVTINGLTSQTSDSNIRLDLQPGENKIRVSTNKDCQGTYEETIFYSGEMMAYPNPIQNNNILNIYLGDLNNTTGTIEIYSVLGKLIYTESTNSNQLRISTDSFTKGLYLVNVTSGTIQKSFKIIKN
jgi:hypothetical protein